VLYVKEDKTLICKITVSVPGSHLNMVIDRKTQLLDVCLLWQTVIDCLLMVDVFTKAQFLADDL